MESLTNSLNEQFNELSTQPTFIKNAIAFLGTSAGLWCTLLGIADLIGLKILVSLLQIILGLVLMSFEATKLAKLLKIPMCEPFINVAEKATSLHRIASYSVMAFLICLVSDGFFGKVVTLIPVFGTVAAYGYLIKLQKNEDVDAFDNVELNDGDAFVA